ncbi:MOP flippase family protein [Rheinheimera sp. MM224]|uniref:MOP flippase family protein n=1 Tax=Rheinheimera sp. MM224 TaxID=3019969 RepID=UPI0039B6CCEC
MLFTTLLMMVQVVILGRFLEPAEYGVLALIMIIIGLGEIFVNFGLSEAIVQNEVNSSIQLSSLYIANIIFSIVVFLFSAVLIWLFFPYHEHIVLCTVAMSSVVINSVCLQFKALCQRDFLFNLLAKIEIISYLAGFLSLLVALANGFGLWSVIIGFLTRIVISVLLHVLNAVKMNWFPAFHFKLNQINEQLKFGFNLLGANLLNYVSSRFDQAVVAAILGPTALGYYSMAFNLVIQPMQKLNLVVTKVAFPVLSRLQNNRDDLTKGYIHVLLAVVLVNTPIMLSLCYLAPEFVGPVLGDNWLPVVVLLQILSFYALMRSTGNAGATLVMATGKAALLFKWNMFVTALQPLVIVLSARFGGVEDVAIALVILQLTLLFIWYQYVIVESIGKCLKKYVLTIFAPAFIFGLLLFIIEQFGSFIEEQSPMYKIVWVMLTCLIYFISILILVKRGYLFNVKKEN